MTILELLQGFDSSIDYSNTVALVLSANSVKAQESSDYWGCTYSLLSSPQPTCMYFNNPTDESLNYECVPRTSILTNLSSIEGMRMTLHKMCKEIESDKVFIVSPNVQGWLKRSLDLFKEYDVFPKEKEVKFLSIQVLHKLHTEAFFATKCELNSTWDILEQDSSYSRSLSLPKLSATYDIVTNPALSANNSRCKAIKEITLELFDSLVAENDL
jgi:hypothetical protein